MKKKTFLSMLLAGAMVLSLAACSQPTEGSQSSSASGSSASGSSSAAGEMYQVGICQFVQHPALDAATQGFIDALNEALPGQVDINNQNASNDIPTCGTICTGFVSDGVDLILANATPALQAATSATLDIPILGTAVTEYGVALQLDDFTGTVGGNVSGTADLAPLDQQAQMILDLFPDAKNVGILYCSAEPNSIYQADVVQKFLEDKGLTVNIYTFADSNDVATVTGSACAESDVLYIPTDNTAAACAAAINNVAEPAGVPIVAGEAGICSGCGVVTLSIDYYELGRTTGQMAVKVLTGESNISEMPIEYYPNPVKMFNAARCQTLGVSVPDDYIAQEG